MAWNTPGSSGNESGPDGRRPQRPRKVGGLDAFLDALRGLFGGGEQPPAETPAETPAASTAAPVPAPAPKGT